ncbi:AAA family ATPase [Pseudonocardia oroxyli]|uniref:AAA family ATPase n=1 Tax=Pseudonocardia oroxyli TaxID=366584 RepID=UPI001FDFBC6E|nr:AAA family ATPase [Pseudonocardia oroxyli]
MSDFGSKEAPSELQDLPFASTLESDLVGVLEHLGYRTTLVSERFLTSEQLGVVVKDFVLSGEENDILLVHVLSHGQLAAGEATVFVLGSDGKTDPGSDIQQWLIGVENTPGAPRTLFMLDLCSAGLSARLPWQSKIDAEVARGWVIAACSGNEAAYDGVFTASLISVLRSLKQGELDISPEAENAPLSTIARAIRQEVNRQTEESDGYSQQITATQLDISASVDPPFFLNPSHKPSASSSSRPVVRTLAQPFLDELYDGLDARHFLDRAAGTVGIADYVEAMVGCFSGRDRELRRISPWLNGVGDGHLAVVTGSPGVGKSALIGILVCAAHGELRAATRPIWDRVAQAPLPITRLAAVHARRRSMLSVASSIAEQLGLRHPASPEQLVDDLLRMREHAVIVLDALDEADEPERISRSLITPLVEAARTRAQTHIRVLVGVRRYPEFAHLLDVAAESELLFDLDDVPEDVLEDDLHKYVTELLRAVPSYRRSGAVSGAFASELGHQLAWRRERNRKREWGPFLVAGLYTRNLLRQYPDARTITPAFAEEFGRAVPHDLPSVLELDLSGDQKPPLLRPVLCALALGKGQGMPISVLERVVREFEPMTDVSLSAIRRTLNEARFYLRQSSDVDSSIVYRLFHQGLVDHLHDVSKDASVRFLDAVLEPLGQYADREWEAAEPYLLRHALAHAADAGRAAEIVDDPLFLLNRAAIRLVVTEGVGDTANIDLARSLDASEQDADRRLNLVQKAIRMEKLELARAAALLALPDPLTWAPCWTVSAPDRYMRMHARHAHERRAQESSTVEWHAGPVAQVRLSDGEDVVASTSMGALPPQLVLSGTNEKRVSFEAPESPQIALSRSGKLWAVGGRDGRARVTGSQFFSTGGSDIEAVRVGHDRTIVSFSDRTTVRSASVADLQDTRFDQSGKLVDVDVSVEEARQGSGGPFFTTRPLRNGSELRLHYEDGVIRWRRFTNPTCYACDSAGRVVATGDADGNVTVWHVETNRLVRSWKVHGAAVSAVAVNSSLSAVISGDEAGLVRITRTGMDGSDRGFDTSDEPSTPSAVAQIVAVTPDCRAFAVGFDDGSVSLYEADSGNWVGISKNFKSEIERIGFIPNGADLLVSVEAVDGSRFIWDFRSRSISGDVAAVDRTLLAAKEGGISFVGGVAKRITLTDGQVKIHNLSIPGPPEAIPIGASWRHAAFAIGSFRSQRVAFVGTDAGDVEVWDLHDLQLVEVLSIFGSTPITALNVLSSEMLLVASGSQVVACLLLDNNLHRQVEY